MIASLATGFSLREPVWLSLALVALLVGWWRHRAHPAVAFGAAPIWRGELPEGLPITWRMRLAWLPAGLEVIALLLLLLALARPVHIASLPPERLGRDVLFCFDRSSSMAADDLAPGESRLAVGKRLAAEFVGARPEDRLGFVTFARYADLGCPPTVDHEAVTQLLSAVQLVDPESPEDATAIGAAVGMATDLLQRSPAPGRVIVLLTDGEENVAVAGAPDQIAPVQAGQWCRQFGIRVHTIVLGRGDRDADGRFTALDTAAVQQLAEVTGGRFFQAPDAATLRAVYGEIDAIEAVAFAEPGVRVDEWYVWPAWLALLTWLGACLVGNSRLGGLR